MPDYIYRCVNGHETSVTEPMFAQSEIICGCGLAMWRKPQIVGVTWGGLPPSRAGMSPVVQDMIDGADKRRDEYLRDKELRHEL